MVISGNKARQLRANVLPATTVGPLDRPSDRPFDRPTGGKTPEEASGERSRGKNDQTKIQVEEEFQEDGDHKKERS